ncbi:MAG TPA: hypothetical protein VFB32_01665, partial [Rudaea sp.]|nr:hypothetical protein [Rudaea sp.]
MTSASPVNTFAWLVRREYWEYRGGFFWAPIIIGAVFLGLIAIALMTAQMAANQHGIQINGIPYDVIKHHMSADEAAKIDAGIGLGLLSLGIPIVIGLFFVVFFYCLGALYNDRSDRSVLFWKSLPITDTQTVLA